MDRRYYTESFRLRVNDFDCNDRVLVSSILDLCQDVAGMHAITLGVGYKQMITQNKIWMVIRTKMEIIKYPPISSHIVVKTWPLNPGRVDMDRDYLICSLDGEEYIKVTSKWVVCDLNSRKLLRAKEANFELDSFAEERLFEEEFVKIQFDDDKIINNSIIKTNYLDLDHNKHINNIKYANYILLGVNELRNKVIKKFQIDYLHELYVDEEIHLKYYLENNVLFVKGSSLNGDAFVAKIDVE